MGTEYFKYTTEEEWLEKRAKYVTSTESCALFGHGKRCTELELFYRKSTGETVEFVPNDRVLAGQYLEPGIAALMGHVLDCKVRPFKEFAYDDESGMGSSFDYEILTGQYEGWLLEVKSVDFMVYRDNWSDEEAPLHIEVQVQHQLELTGRPGCIIGALVGGNSPKYIVRERNKAMGSAIRNRIKRFWRDVKANNEPEPVFPDDAEFVIALHQSSGDRVITADQELELIIGDYERARKEEKHYKDLANTKKAEALLLLDDDVGKVVCEHGLSLSCGNVKASEGTLITEDMVGTRIGAKKGRRNFRVTRRKQK